MSSPSNHKGSPKERKRYPLWFNVLALADPEIESSAPVDDLGYDPPCRFEIDMI